MRIGVLADTHMPKRAKALPAPLLKAFAAVDLIIHAGDLTDPALLEQLGTLAPVEAVAGNNDPPELMERFGAARLLELGGFKIGVAHGHVGRGATTLARALSHFQAPDCVIFGHSHMPYLQWHGGTLLFNPGSPTDKRRAPFCAYGLLHLDPSGLRGEIVPLT